MLCCSSCGLPIQGHQLPMGARCSILFNEASHASRLELECTVCLQPWASHSWGKHIPKDCKFHWQQSSGDTATEDLDPAEDGDVHSRLACITQENHAIKAQLSQLTELVCQLLPQPAQAAPQSADSGNMPPASSPGEDQAVGTPGASLGPLPPLWLHPRDAASGVSPRGHQAMSLSPTGQPSASPHGNPLPAVPAPLALPNRQAPAIEIQLQCPWVSPVSTSMLGQGTVSSLHQLSPTVNLSPVQVPASIKGKIQCSEYIYLSELLAYDFQYRYSSLDDSQTLEIINGKLSLAPKWKARHLSTLQLWLHAWHLYEDTLLSFYPYRYLELSHYWHHIADLDQCFHWAAMLSYDVKFHHRYAVQGLPFSTFNQQLYIMTLDATAVKVSAHR